jgi:penicillin-binding protein 1A
MNTHLNNKKGENKKAGKFRQLLNNSFTKRKKEPNFFLSVFVACIKLFIIAILIIGFAGFGAVLGVAKAYVDGTPKLDIAKIEDQSLTSFIYDSEGNLITEYKGLEHRIWAPLSEIPLYVQQALIATEDIRFYSHNGLDYKRLAGAFINNLRNEAVQGGSTLTQQLIKNTLLSPERTYKRKIQEAYLAIQLEKEYNKEEILEAYLNTIYLGSGNYGIKAAALNYFGKELNQLNLRECAVLVGITKNPYRYDPRLNFYSRNQPEVTYERANLVLRLMYDNGFITKAEYESARFDEKNPDSPRNEGFTVLEESSHQKLYDYPYFIEYVIEDLRNELIALYGWDEKEANNLILTGGLHIYTTLDTNIQSILEDTIYNYNKYPKTKHSKHSVRRVKNGDRVIDIPQPQAAAVVLDHSTGELKAMVGGRMDPQERFWTNRANQAWSPGSAIKPLAVYAPFIEAGYPGGIIIEDVPVPMKGWIVDGKESYPSNYNTSRFYGPTPASRAVLKSYNVSSARTLTERVGMVYSINKLKEMGITSKNYVDSSTATPSSLSLGSDPINMIEITAAYGTLDYRVMRGSIELLLARPQVRVFTGGESYLISINETRGDLIIQEIVSPEGKEAELILGAMEWTNGQKASLEMEAVASPAHARLAAASSSWTIGPQGMFRIINWPKLCEALSPYFAQKAKDLPPFEIAIGCTWKENRQMATLVWDGSKFLTVPGRETEKYIELEGPVLAATLFGGPCAYNNSLGLFEKLLPVPIHIPNIDHI